jgi:hypothetical protein
VLNANRVFEEYSCNFIPETSLTMRIELNTELFPSPWPQPPVHQSMIQPVPQPWPQPLKDTDIKNVLSMILTDKPKDVSSYQSRMPHPKKMMLIQFNQSSNLPTYINESMDQMELQIVFATDKSNILDNFHTKFMNLLNHPKVPKLSLDFSMCDDAVTSNVIRHNLFNNNLIRDGLFSEKFLLNAIIYSHIVWKGVRLNTCDPSLKVVVIEDIVIDFENCKIGEILLFIRKQKGQQGFPRIRIRIYPPFYLEKRINLESDQSKFPIENLDIIAQDAQGQMHKLPGFYNYTDSGTLNIRFHGPLKSEFQKQSDCCVS